MREPRPSLRGKLRGSDSALTSAQRSPSFYQYTADTGTLAQAHTATFAIVSVSGGTHTVSALWNSVFGGTVFGHGMTMVVSHG